VGEYTGVIMVKEEEYDTSYLFKYGVSDNDKN
jgi:hypothetical protein